MLTAKRWFWKLRKNNFISFMEPGKNIDLKIKYRVALFALALFLPLAAYVGTSSSYDNYFIFLLLALIPLVYVLLLFMKNRREMNEISNEVGYENEKEKWAAEKITKPFLMLLPLIVVFHIVLLNIIKKKMGYNLSGSQGNYILVIEVIIIMAILRKRALLKKEK